MGTSQKLTDPVYDVSAVVTTMKSDFFFLSFHWRNLFLRCGCCCVDITLTGAFLQEDDLGLWEEVGAADDHLFSPADQAAGQAGFLHLGQLLSRALGWERRSGKEKRMIILRAVLDHAALYFLL